MNNNNDKVKTYKLVAGNRRTYYIDIQKNKSDDYYLTMTESVKRNDGSGFDKHKIMLFKEDLTRFLENLTAAVEHIKTDLMPDYDFNFFAKKQEEWAAQNKNKDLSADNNNNNNEDITW